MVDSSSEYDDVALSDVVVLKVVVAEDVVEGVTDTEVVADRVFDGDAVMESLSLAVSPTLQVRVVDRVLECVSESDGECVGIVVMEAE